MARKIKFDLTSTEPTKEVWVADGPLAGSIIVLPASARKFWHPVPPRTSLTLSEAKPSAVCYVQSLVTSDDGRQVFWLDR